MEPADELKIAQAYAETFRGCGGYGDYLESMQLCVRHMKRAISFIENRIAVSVELAKDEILVKNHEPL